MRSWSTHDTVGCPGNVVTVSDGPSARADQSVSRRAGRNRLEGASWGRLNRASVPSPSVVDVLGSDNITLSVNLNRADCSLCPDADSRQRRIRERESWKIGWRYASMTGRGTYWRIEALDDDIAGVAGAARSHTIAP